ncbi:cysteine desulfurase family protein [Curvivirga sp.]|uniref:cysteine desulfurase family protein n=1 Tax=Curvivirga sp. TaxID=2856848 RepID=UPI003B594BEB
MRNKPVNPIYLDYHATTPCDPRVVDVMIPWFTQKFGNPHSADHRHGWEAAEAVEDARKSVAKLIGATSKEIYFTSGATESNNLAIKGVARARKELEGRDHVITVATEHKCVLESVTRLQAEGFRTTYLPVNADGSIDLAKLEDALDEKTAIVSIMAANNEIGILHPMKEIASSVHKVGAYLHSDCAQAVGKIPVNVKDWDVDLMSISGHKIYGPKGIGAIFIRKRPRIAINPLMDGGGQERGIRSGTLAPALCVGLGKACDIASIEMDEEDKRIKSMRDQLWENISYACPIVELNGSYDNRLSGNLNITIPGVEGAEVMAALDGLSVSGGSACSSGGGAHSHVLSALGHDPARVAAGIRIGLGRFTTSIELDMASEMLIAVINKLTRN